MNNPMQMLQVLRSNPMQMLQKAGFNLPQNVSVSDPNAIIQHLMNSGQVSQQQFERARQMAQMFRR